ncbi:YhdP family protein [Nitrospira sp. M1]
MKRRFSQIAAGGGLLVIVVFGAFMILPFFVNPTYFTGMAFDYMQRTLGPHLTVGQARVLLWPYPHVEVSDVIVKEHPDAHAFFRATRMSLDLKIFPLLRQEFVVKKLFIEQPEMEVKRDRDGQWRLFQSARTSLNDSVFADLFLVEEVVIADGRLTFIDESPREAARGVVFENVMLSFVGQEPDMFSATIEASGRIRQTTRASVFFFEGLVNCSPSEDSQAVFQFANVPQVVKMNGKMQVRDLDVGQVTDFFTLQSKGLNDLGLAHIDSQVTLMPGQVGYELTLPELHIESQAGSLSGNANISGLLASGDLTMYASVESTPFSLKMVQAIIPKQRLPATLLPLWEDAELGGTIQVRQATIAGSTRPDVGVSVVGTFQLVQSYWKHQTGKPELDAMNGEIVVEPDRIRLIDFSGVYDALPIHLAHGVILFKDSGPWIELDLHSQIEASQITEVIGQLTSSTQAQGYLARLTGVEGLGNLHMQFAGQLDSPEGVKFRSGEYEPQELTWRVPGLPEPMVLQKGRFVFSVNDIQFDEVEGVIGDSPFRVQGTIRTARQPVFEQFRGEVTLRQELLHSLLRQSTQFQEVTMNGEVGLRVELSGLIDAPKLKGRFDLLDSSLQWPRVMKKPRGVRGALSFDLGVHQNGNLVIHQAELSILPLRLSVRANVRVNPTVEVHGRVNTGPINLGLLPEGVMVGNRILRAGILEVSLDVRGRGLNWSQWSPQGWIALTDGVVKARDLPTPITNLLFRLKVSPTFAEVKRFELKMEKSDIHLTGTVKHWRDKPEIDVVLESSHFDIDLLIPKGQGSTFRDWLADLAGTSTVMGNIHIDHPTYKKLEAENLSGILKIRDSLVTLDRIRSQAYGQPIAGRVFIHLPKERPVAIRSSFHLKGLPFDHIQQSFEHEDRLITGKLSVRGMVQGHGRNPRGVMATLNGNMDVVMEQGHVKKGTVLPQIVSLLNLPKVLRGKVDLHRDGFPFTKMTGTLNIQDGIISSDNVIVDSPIMKMTTAGTFDMVSDQLDVATAVSPFGQHADFLRNIPLFDRIGVGSNKGIVTALFHVRGSITTPDVRYKPLESFSEGITGFSQQALDTLRTSMIVPTAEQDVEAQNLEQHRSVE